LHKTTRLAAAVLGLAALTYAQTGETPLPEGQVGVPYFVDLFPDDEALDTGDEFSFTITFSVASGSLPPGLSLSRGGEISGTPTAPGDFRAIVNIHISIIIPDFEGFEFDFPFPVLIAVRGTAGSGIAVAPGGISVSVLQGGDPQPQGITITNLGSAAEPFTAAARVDNGGGWLSVSPAAGSAPPFGQTSVQAAIDPRALVPGTYSGAITITATRTGAASTIPVIVTVAGGGPSIQLSQTGVRFQAVQNGPAPAPETIQVLNSGAGSLAFDVATSTRSGGRWLSVSPVSGTATAGRPAGIAVSANPSGLAPGDYYAEIQILSNTATNSPQRITAVLNVLPAATLLPAQPDRTGVIFVARAAGAQPAAQTVTVRNVSAVPLNFITSIALENGTNWLAVTPATGTITAAQPAALRIAANQGNLAAGVYRGEVALNFTQNIPRVRITVVLIVLPPGPPLLSQRNAVGCTPTRLLPVFTRLGAGFANPVGWPVALTVTVVDDCGDPMRNGSVQATFSNGDPPLSLLPLGDGSWSATWQPQNPRQQTVITVNAVQPQPSLTGRETLGGRLDQNQSVPIVSTGGVVSAASFAAFQPVAPGSFISIFGTRLSNGLTVSPSVPYSTRLGATSAVLGSRELALQFAADGQINAVIPFDVPLNATQQLVVANGDAVSQPQPVIIAAAQPAVFTQNLQGTGPAIAVAFTSDGRSFLVDAAHPARAGDALVIYSAGLGAVDPPVPAGTPAPSSPLSRTTNTVTATIGGVNAEVFFAGLAPGFPAIYQVNAIVPAGVSGPAVPLVLKVAGRESAPVTIAVE
jgi:uncharacterized protein (TIGR03437 family)